MDTDIKITFGKHAGKFFSEIIEIDPTYLSWLAKQTDFKGHTNIPALAQAYLDELSVIKQREIQQRKQSRLKGNIEEMAKQNPSLVKKCIKCRKKADKDTGYVFRLVGIDEDRYIYLHSQCFMELEKPTPFQIQQG